MYNTPGPAAQKTDGQTGETGWLAGAGTGSLPACVLTAETEGGSEKGGRRRWLRFHLARSHARTHAWPRHGQVIHDADAHGLGWGGRGSVFVLVRAGGAAGLFEESLQGQHQHQPSSNIPASRRQGRYPPFARPRLPAWAAPAAR